ncbi:MAG TPA: hypothetical protein DCZ94_17395 [Lentisphaeria bacterium]|nr:MAG: hypothetical protein A2X48_20785 [Lentisphaerae bacterium GWF2_49_21]HBC88719.1 hypothetical protein [Lentisphaeria bacterium]
MKTILIILLTALSFTAWANPIMEGPFRERLFFISILCEAGALSMILSYFHGFDPFKIFPLWLFVHLFTYIVFLLVIGSLEETFPRWMAIVSGELAIILIETSFLKLISDLNICRGKDSRKLKFLTLFIAVFIANLVSIIVSLLIP